MTFEEKLDVEWKNLGGILVEVVPDNWEKIYFLGRVTDNADSASYEADYYVKIDGKIEEKNERIKYSEIEEDYRKTVRILMRIYKIYIECKIEPFSELIFELDSDYKLKVNFLYDKILDNNHFFHRFQNWKKKLEQEELS